MLELCGGLQSAEKNYVEKCNMEYDPGDEDTQDTCNSIKALKLDGGTQIYNINFWNGLYEALTGPGGWELMPCNENVKWTNTNPSPTFNGTCNNDKSCESAIDSLFENIENSVSLSGGEGFPF